MILKVSSSLDSAFSLTGNVQSRLFVDMYHLASARFLAYWEDLHAGDDDVGLYVVVMISSKEKCF